MKVKGFLKIAKSLMFKRQAYQLKFVKEDDNKWYVDFPDWPFAHHNLMMVAGADKLCALLSDDGKCAEVTVRPAKRKANGLKDAHCVELRRVASKLFSGAFYEVHNIDFSRKTIWLCPVTLCVLGKYPEYIYITKHAIFAPTTTGL